MKLTLNDLSSITLGVDRVALENGRIRFHRFTEDEEIFYKERDQVLGRTFSSRVSATAGVKLYFKTNSKRLGIKAGVAYATSRTFYSFDIFENNKLIGHLDNFKEDELLENYTVQSYELSEASGSFELSSGYSNVAIYFPWSVCIDGFEIELDDGAVFEPIKPKHRLLAYGDSITQGYDATRPSNRYIARIANLLDAEETNKAVGGEIFVDGLLKKRLDFDPDYITVAYGTNDWSTTSGEGFYENARSFYKILSERYPDAKIFAITPIWRVNYMDEKPFGDFFSVEATIREVTSDLKNVSVISGFDLVEHDAKKFADLRLHPRDKGFDDYYNNLSKRIKELI